MKLYTVTRNDRQFFKGGVRGGMASRSSWVDDIEDCTFYKNIGHAKGRVTRHKNMFPNAAPLKIVVFEARAVDVIHY